MEILPAPNKTLIVKLSTGSVCFALALILFSFSRVLMHQIALKIVSMLSMHTLLR